MPAEQSYLDVSLRKIAKGAGIAFTGTFIGLVLGYFSRMVIARWLGAADYGLICLGFAAMTIGATLASVGLPSGIERYVSFYKGKEDPGKIKGAILGAIKISLPLSIAFAVLFFFTADWICLHVFHSPDLTPVLRVFSLAIPFCVLASNFMSATVGFQDLRYRVYVNDLFQNIFKLIAIVTLLALGFGVMGAAWGWALAIMGMPFLAFYFLERKVFPLFHSRIKAVPMERELFSYSWPLIFASVAGLITGWTDTLMLGYFCSAADVGIYNAALPTAQVLGIGSGAFAVIFMPVASELCARNRGQDLGGIYSAVTKWILAIVLPGFLLMALFSRSVLDILFGPEFIAGAPALSILAGSFFVSSLFGLSGPVLQVHGKTKVLMICSFCTAGANFILNLFLIPRYGINGAAAGTGISVLLGSILGLFFVIRVARMQPFRKSFFKPIIASLLSVSLVYALTKYLIGVSIPALIGMLFVFLALYFFLLLLLKSFEPADLMIMRAIDQRLGTKSDWLRKIIQKFL